MVHRFGGNPMAAATVMAARNCLDVPVVITPLSIEATSMTMKYRLGVPFADLVMATNEFRR